MEPTTFAASALVVVLISVKVFLLWILADFITGIVHWWQDTYGNPNWPIIGKYVVEPNLIHHKNPRNLLKGNYWYRVSTSIVAALVIGPTLWFVGWHSWEMIICLIFSSQGNEVHAISHRTDKENGRFFVFLQKFGIIQRRKTHGWHHSAPYDTNFCVMTEYLNPFLNRLKFWSRMEKFLEKVFGVKVLRGSDVRGGI